jgi:signal transduction histidine kinase
MKEITTTVFPVFVVFTNFSVAFLCLPRKKSLFFTIAVFGAVVAANFAADIIIAKLGINDPTKIFRAYTYLPVVILLFRGLTSQKIFAYFAPMTFAATLVLPFEMLTRIFIPFGEFWYWLAMLVFPTAVLIIYIHIVRRYGRGMIERLFADGTEKEWSLYALSAFICYIVVSGIYPTLAEYVGIVLLLLFFIAWFLIVLCFAIINTHEKTKQKYEAAIAREIITSGRGYYEKLTGISEQLHILRHDYKHHLASIQKMIKSGGGEEIQDYLDALNGDIDEKTVNDYCKSRVINALLDSFFETCKNEKIEFKVNIILPPEGTIDDYELCIILGNLMENAITACLRIPINELRYIEISMKPIDNKYVIKVENSFDGVIKNDGKTLYTTKKDGGLGIKSIVSVARKWGGEYNPVWDDKNFCAYVVLMAGDK